MLRLFERLFSPLAHHESRKVEKPVARSRVNLTGSQLRCIQGGMYHYDKLVNPGNCGEDVCRHHLAQCFWQIIFVHFEDLQDAYGGYSVSLTMADVVEKLRRSSVMDRVLLPKLNEIVNCADCRQKAEFAYQYVFILMAAAFDCSGGTIQYAAIRKMLNADELNPDEQENIRTNRQEYLEPLGFKPHRSTEDGEEFTSWYWKD